MSANEFVPIRVSTLRGEININFNTYVKVAEKYILYFRDGENCAPHRDKLIPSGAAALTSESTSCD